jgi:hypothetical protein
VGVVAAWAWVPQTTGHPAVAVGEGEHLRS